MKEIDHNADNFKSREIQYKEVKMNNSMDISGITRYTDDSPLEYTSEKFSTE